MLTCETSLPISQSSPHHQHHHSKHFHQQNQPAMDHRSKLRNSTKEM